MNLSSEILQLSYAAEISERQLIKIVSEAPRQQLANDVLLLALTIKHAKKS